MNKSFFVKVFGEQKHPSPNQQVSKMSTKEYFEKDKQNGPAATNMSDNKVRGADTGSQETQKLKDDLRSALEKQKKYETKLVHQISS